MKIKKFNENINENYFYCAVTIDGDVDESYIFENKDDMDNWILNYINTEIPNYLDFVDSDINGIVEVDNDEYIFTNVIDALNWYAEHEPDGGGKEIFYDLDVKKIRNINLKYDVEKYRDIKKYNV